VLIDSHCHLDFPDFEGEHEALLARAREHGVAGMVTICTKITKFDQVRAVAEAHEQIYCSVGIHPHSAGEEPETSAEALAEMARHPKVVGIGESGLDYYYDFSPREAQQRSFRQHIRAARATGLPLIVHTRDADDDTIAILREEAQDGAIPGLIHCFTAGHKLAEAALDLGFSLSFSGILTFNKAEEIRQVAAAAPLDRILVETDAPYLAPVPKRGKRNEPAFVAHTAKRLAEVKGVGEAELAAATTENFFRLFSKVPRGAMTLSGAAA